MRAGRQPAPRRHIPELDAVRTLAMLAVLVIHTTAKPIVQLTPDSSAYALYVLFNRLGSLAVPGFIFVSGLVLFHNYYDRPLNGAQVRVFYSRRAAAAIVPYILWSVGYYVLTLLQAGGWRGALGAFSVWGLVRSLFTGTAYYHLYFMVVSIQFYLVFPALLWFFKRSPRAMRYALAGGVLAQVGLYLFSRYVSTVPGKASIALSYASHFMLGAYVALNYERLTGLLDRGVVAVLGRRIRWAYVLAAGWALAGLGYSVAYYLGFGFGIWYDTFWYELLWGVYTLLSALVLLHWGRVIHTRGGPRLLRLTAGLGAASFGIYLVHPVFVAAWDRFVVVSTPALYHLAVAAEVVVVAALSWGFVAAVTRWFPYSWIVFGSRRSAQADR